MKAFVSWSGGKDCMLALYYFLQDIGNQSPYLVNFIDPSIHKSKSHQIDSSLLVAQSEALNIPLIQEAVQAENNYEFHLKKVISELKTQGVNAGIFGDIHLQEHRTWIERVCQEMDITAVFPLWGRTTSSILDNFISMGFRSLIIAVRNKAEFAPLLGRIIDQKLVEELKQIEAIDLCGEQGEYHSFVFDGPIFNKCIHLSKDETYTEGNAIFLPIKIEKQG